MSFDKGTCPFCRTNIWGEGWNPKTGEHFYSHVQHEYNTSCCWELGFLDGTWIKYHKVEQPEMLP